MPIIKLTSKRQATLPKALCEDLQVKAGDSIIVERKIVDGKVCWCLEPASEVSLPWFGALSKYAAGKSHDLDDIRESMSKTPWNG